MDLFCTRTDSNHPHFKELVDKLDSFIRTIDGEEFDFFHQFNQSDKLNNVVIVTADTIPVGCGAFRPANSDTIEIKRMFVEDAYRGKKIAQTILSELEKWAVELGYKNSILETAIELKSAHQLYTNMGYERIPNFEQYIGIERSICFGKKL